MYRGVEIPLRFFKVSAFIHNNALAATGYVLDQSPQLEDLPEIPRPGALDEAPPLGPFRTFQIPIRDIAALTWPNWPPRTGCPSPPASAPHLSGSTWRELTDHEDLDLDFELHT